MGVEVVGEIGRDVEMLLWSLSVTLKACCYFGDLMLCDTLTPAQSSHSLYLPRPYNL